MSVFERKRETRQKFWNRARDCAWKERAAAHKAHSRSVSPAPVAMATTLEEKVLQTLHSVREGVSVPAEISCSLPVRIFAALNFRGCELSLHGRQFDANGSATCERVGRRERESDAERDSCEGHCNYSLSVMAVYALAPAL
ncbi:hypothetical protein ABG768_012423 [Culter alburnus]|uniref:Uncharacterized protein n=1 Tax=Culter alburnus TaxID=194366 RepID=A0AAW1ZA88_CULAL